MTVQNNKHLFLRLSVLFCCLIFTFFLFTPNTYAIPDDGNRGATDADLEPFGGRGPVITPGATAPNISSSGGIGSNPTASASDGGGTGEAEAGNGNTQGYKEVSADNKVSYYIYSAAVGLGGIITSISSAIFDYAIDQVVLKMGCWFVETPSGNCEGIGAGGGIGTVVNELWMVIRDLFNILFIFSLIFIGLKTILSPNDSSTKKALGLLIAAALLINFSLYVTKVIVDMSNYAAVAIHSQATQGIGGAYGLSVTGSDGEKTTIAQSEAKSLAGAYMQAMNLSSWFAHTDLSILSVGKIIIFSLMFLLTAVILAIVFAWGGIMLITRFVALIIFMIFSPAMFLGWVLPQFKKYADNWWSKFLSYAFFAPAYIFMLYLGLYALIQLRNGIVGDHSSYADAVLNGGPAMSIFLFYVIAIAFLVAATKVGQMMGVAGATSAMGAVRGAKNRIIGGAKWGTGYVAGSIIGSAARKYGESMDRIDAAKDKPRSRTRRLYRNAFTNIEAKKWGGAPSYKSLKDDDKKEAARHASAHGAYTAQQTIISSPDPIEREASLAQASPSTLTQMAQTKEGRVALTQNAGSLTSSQFKAILDSDDIIPEVKSELKEARLDSTRHKIKDGHKTLGEGIKDASMDQIDSLDVKDDLFKNAMYLQESHMDYLKKKWSDNETFRLLKEEREKQIKEKVKNNKIAEVINTRKGPKEIAKLPPEILENYVVIEELKKEGKLDVSLLRAIASESPANKKTIGAHIKKVYGGKLPKNIKKYIDSPQGADFLS